MHVVFARILLVSAPYACLGLVCSMLRTAVSSQVLGSHMSGFWLSTPTGSGAVSYILVEQELYRARGNLCVVET